MRLCVHQFKASTSCPWPTPQVFELFTIGLFKFPPPSMGQNFIEMPHPIFFVKGEISIYDFLLIDLVLKPRTCRPFSWPFAHISKPFALKTSIFKDLTLVFHWKYSTLPVQLPYPSQVSLKFLTPCAQATVKCLWVAWRGGMLKPRIDRRFNIYIFLIIKMIFE